MAMAPRRVRFGVLGVDTSGGFPRGPLESMAAEEDLHKGLVRMGVSDVAPPTLKEVAHTLGLTFAVTSGVAESYSESVDVESTPMRARPCSSSPTPPPRKHSRLHPPRPLVVSSASLVTPELVPVSAICISEMSMFAASFPYLGFVELRLLESGVGLVGFEGVVRTCNMAFVGECVLDETSSTTKFVFRNEDSQSGLNGSRGFIGKEVSPLGYRESIYTCRPEESYIEVFNGYNAFG
ncbi:hypothetical protein BHE74_00025249 [Ensete ventricosum]|nr:hypothetical protein BHE74_00025249 [Ensete ventricosum]